MLIRERPTMGIPGRNMTYSNVIYPLFVDKFNIKLVMAILSTRTILKCENFCSYLDSFEVKGGPIKCSNLFAQPKATEKVLKQLSS